MRAIAIIGWVLVGLFASSLNATAYEVGQAVELKATNPAVYSCDRLDEDDMPTAYRSLSDHCPIVFNFSNQDLD